MSEIPTDDQVLADPGSFTVEQVTTVFARSLAEHVEDAKAIEAAGKDRQGIVGWEPPQPKVLNPGDEEFPIERLLGPDGPAITGQPIHVIAGALYGDDGEAVLTRSEVQDRIDSFLEREVESA